MRKLLLTLLTVAAFAGVFQSDAQAIPCFGCTGPLSGLEYPEPRVGQESQGWWLDKTITGGVVPAVPPANAPIISTHVHMQIPFPTGERLSIPASGPYVWDYFAQWHNGNPGTVTQNRGGQFQLGPCCVKDPTYLGKPITLVDQSYRGTLTIPSNEVAIWRTKAGKFENRFTSDTKSKFGGKRHYMSGAWNTFLGAAPGAVTVLSRGWYVTTGYTNVAVKDSNIGSGVGFRASELANVSAPATVTMNYVLSEGATLASVYLDPNLHVGSKGTTIIENKPGTTGSFSFSAVGLAPGVHFLLVAGWEKASDGWNAGVIRVPFKVG